MPWWGYSLKNTVTDNGYVSRGVCRVDPEGKLVDITEHTRIEKRQGGIASTEDGGKTWEPLDPDTVVSHEPVGIFRQYPGGTEPPVPGIPPGKSGGKSP